MPRPQAGDAHDIEAHVTFRAGCIAFGKYMGRARNACLLRRGDGLKGRGVIAPRLDLDESYGAAAPGDDVDFAKSGAGLGFQAPREDPPAGQPQPRNAQGFREAPAPFGLLVAALRPAGGHLSLANSRARL